MATATAKPTATKSAPRVKAIKTKLIVREDNKAEKNRVRKYEVQNRETGATLGFVVEIWATKEMEYKNSVKEGRRQLSAIVGDKEIGKNFGSRALAVAAVRKAAA